MDPSTPKLSVIIPNRNHGCYLEACIHSAYSNDVSTELIIIDDNSDDESVDAIKAAQENGLSILLIQHNEAKGVVFGMNEGLQHAKGDYVQFRAADDLSVPQTIRPAIELLEKHPSAGLVCGDIGYFYQDPRQPTIERLFTREKPTYLNPDDLTNELGPNPIFAHSVIFRTEAIKDVGPFREEHAFYSDWFVTHVAAFSFGICYLPHCMSLARLSATSYSNSGSKYHASRQAVVDQLKYALSSLDETVRERIQLSGIFDFFASPRKTSLTDAERKDSTGMIGVIGRQLDQHLEELSKITADGSVYFYGAGTHSAILLSQWQRRGLSGPDKIWVTRHTGEDPNEWNGIPVEKIAESSSDSLPNLVVISSKSYEPEMYETVHRLGVSRILTFWGCPPIGLQDK